TSSVEQAFVLTPAEAPQARSEDSSRACVSTYQATTTPLNPCSRSTVLSRANPHSPHSAENTKRMALCCALTGPGVAVNRGGSGSVSVAWALSRCWRHRRRLLLSRFLSSSQQDPFQQGGLYNAERRGPSISYPVSGESSGKRACDKVSTALNSEEYVQCRVPSESAREGPAQVWILVTDGLPQHDMSLTGGYCEGSLEEGKEAHPSDSPSDNEGG
ncbi:hypothetical protein CCUS01_14400, partial [Colletotrichum cuscutae]